MKSQNRVEDSVIANIDRRNRRPQEELTPESNKASKNLTGQKEESKQPVIPVAAPVLNPYERVLAGVREAIAARQK